MGVDLFTLQLAKKYAEKLLEGKELIVGKSAYEVAQNNGYKGSVTEWLQSLKGDSGVSPTIEITEDKEGNHTVIIKDKNGSHFFVVKDGKGGGNGEVISFNDRKGAVSPQLGDYDIEKIGILDDDGNPILKEDGEPITFVEYATESLKNKSKSKGVPIAKIEDSLSSIDTDKALSANQGCILNNKIVEIQHAVEELQSRPQEKGKDGISPTIEIHETEEGLSFTITDVSGEKTYYLKNGKDGKDVISSSGSTKKQLIVSSENNSLNFNSAFYPNIFYIFPQDYVDSLTITLNEPLDDTIVNEYHFMFKTGEVAPVFSLPAEVRTPKDFKIEANKIYEISILENCLSYQYWDK